MVWAGKKPQRSTHSKPPQRAGTHSARLAQKPEEQQQNNLCFLRLISGADVGFRAMQSPMKRREAVAVARRVQGAAWDSLAQLLQH